MKVILIENIKTLGKVNDIKEVSDGYAKNFLFSKNLAIPATNENINRLKSKLEKEKKDLENIVIKLKDVKNGIEKVDTYSITANKNETTGKLFGTITKNDIKELFKNIDIKDIVLPKSGIKHIGVYPIDLDLGNGVKANIKLKVI